MMDPFALRPQRLPACGQNMNLRCVAEYVLRQSSHRLDDMFAIIEHQQHSSLAQRCENGSEGIL